MTAPLSYGQERMWLLDQLTDGAAALNLVSATILRGPLSLAATRGVLSAIVRGHDILRTVITVDDGVPAQVVRPTIGSVRLVDLTSLSRDLVESTRDRLLAAEAHRPFDLGTGPVLRCTVIRTGRAEHTLVLAMHHAATDAWSMRLIAEEFAATYADATAGTATPPVPAPQYQDFARDQRTRPLLTAAARARIACLADVAGEPLPLDRPAEHRANRAAVWTTALPPSLGRRLEELRAEEGGSTFTLVLAALTAVLHRLSGDRRIGIGTPAAGRTRPELESTLGYFGNVLVLLADFTPPVDRPLVFRDLWRRLREDTVEALAVQDLPYETVLAQLRSHHHDRSAPLVSVLCVQQQPDQVLALPGLDAEPIDVPHPHAHHDLTVEVVDDGVLHLSFQYDSSVLDEPTVVRLAGYLRAALIAVVDDPDVRCAGLPIDRPAITAAPVPSTDTLHGLFEAQVTRTPDGVALRHGTSNITYRALNQRANRLARRLRTAGVRHDDRVALLLPRSLDLVAAQLAVLKAGAAYHPLDPADPPKRVATLLAAAGPRCVITTAGAADVVESVPVLIVDEVCDLPGTNLGLDVSADQTAYVIHTSGSTGPPKAVLNPHRGTVNRLRWMWTTQPYRPAEVACLRAPPTFVDSVAEVFGPLLHGVTAVVLDQDTTTAPDRFVEALAGAGASRLLVVPSLLRTLLDVIPDLGTALPTVTTWTCSGEPLTADLVHRFHQALPGRRLLNLYGSTEIAADAVAAEVPACDVVPIGTPLPGVTTAVRTRSGGWAPPLGTGELHVGGTAVAHGYLGRPGETAARFVPDPRSPLPGGRAFRTGDLVRIAADGALEHLGRTDDQVKIRGMRVDPGEVEQALAAHPAVRRAAVVPAVDPTGATMLAAHVVVDRSVDLRAHLRTLLPPHLIPAVIVPVTDLPLTTSGKIDRRALSVDVSPHPGEVERPSTQTELIVAELFADLLPVHWRGVHDDFFDLGGHSLVAATLVHRLRDRLGIQLGLRDLFAAPTIGALAGLADRTTPKPMASAPMWADTGGPHDPFPLTEVQQAYWIGRDPDLDLGNVATYGYFELSVTDLDPRRLEHALTGLIARHDALRLVIRPDGTQQVLAEVPEFRLPVLDLGDVTVDSAERRLATVRAEMSHQVLPADRWPLFDVRATLTPAGMPDVLHVGIDALIVDAYSVGLLMGELGLRYRDPHAELPPIDLTFRDCILARAARGDDREQAWRYWHKRLHDLPPGPDLPLTRSPSEITAPRFTRWSHTLAPESWGRLREQAAAIGVTPPVVLLTAFAEVVRAWSRQPRFSLMLTLFDRDLRHPHANRVIGDFTSLNLLEVDHDQAAGFAESARALQDRLWTDLDHRTVSGVDVARVAARRRGGRPVLLAPVVFTSNLGLAVPAGGPPLGDIRFAVTQTPQLYLDHQVSETPDGVLLSWDVLAELFPDGLIDAAFTAYTRLIDDLATDRHDWSAPVPGLAPSTQLVLRAEANATEVVREPITLPALAAEGAAATPDALAVVAGHRRLTHGEVVERAGRVAGALRAAGVRSGDVVAVRAHKGWEQVVAVLAVTAAGAAYLPLDPDLPPNRLRSLLRRTRTRHVLTQSALTASLAGLGGSWVRPVDTDDWAAPALDLRQPLCRPGDLAYVIFTSGSTGSPKGVMIDHAGAVNTLLDINGRFDITNHDRVLGLSSLSFDLSVYDVFGVLAVGGALVLPAATETRDPGRWLDLVREHRVTVWNSVPALMGLAADRADLAGEGLRPLRLALLSGDWVPVDLPDRVRALAPGAEVISLGGATEASIWSVHHHTARPAPGWTSVPYGTPLANQRAHVLDAGMRPRPDWVPGDLYLAGDGLALGYWDDPDRTAAAFVHHPRTGERLYRTGDVARYHPDGVLEFLGRDDHQVKINGFRVELGEVETALRTVPGVVDGVVVAVGPPRGDRRLAAFYISEDDPGEPAIHATLRATLPAYLVPTTVTRLAALPLTGNGKVDRTALSAGLGTRQAAPAESVVDDDLVTMLTETLRVVLGVEQVGAHDNFFVLGGTSLVALRLIARLQTELGVRVALTEVYDSPTVAELARAVRHARAGGGDGGAVAPVLVPDDDARFEPFPLTPIQEAYWMGGRAGQWLGGVSTHSYVELDVVDLDLDRLRTAVRVLIDRHDALRTVLSPDGTQRVLAEVPAYDVHRTDLRGVVDPGPALEMIRAELSHRSHDPYTWPLFTIAATLLDDTRTRLHIGVDLMIADALSFRVLQRELLTCYADGDLSPLACRFRDYQLAVRRADAGPETQRARHYWRDRLPTLPPPPPLTVSSSTGEPPRFERLEGRLDPEDWTAVRTAAAQRNLTPSGVLCAAFADVLALWTQVGRFTLNVTTFNRLPLHPDIDGVVGDFTTTTLLAVDTTAHTFARRAGTVQAQLFADLDHRAVSGVDVLRMLRSDPDLRARAFAPVVFTSLLEMDHLARTESAWEATVVYGVSQTPQVWLDHQVYEDDGALRYNWDHLADVFPPGYLDAMFTAYGRLLRSLATDGAYYGAAPGWPT